jgi:hypothetical protein
MEVLSLIISSLALIISSVIAIKGWAKHRTIYGLEYNSLFPDKTRGEGGNEEIRKKLNSGEYTVLHAYYDRAQYNVLLGKLKK